MTANKSLIETLYDQYQNEPGVRLFVEAISASTGFPVGAVIDTFVGTRVKEIAASRLRSFYNELNNGDIILNENLIENDDFLCSYFAVVNYVTRSKSDEKAKRFAKIIKGLYKKDFNINQFEDYTSIFNQLSEREFIILCLKLEFEENQNHILEDLKPLDPYQKTNPYWSKFVAKIQESLNIENEELSSLLIRLERTGCYKIHFGHYEGEDGIGDTTVIFKKLYEIVKN